MKNSRKLFTICTVALMVFMTAIPVQAATKHASTPCKYEGCYHAASSGSIYCSKHSRQKRQIAAPPREQAAGPQADPHRAAGVPLLPADSPPSLTTTMTFMIMTTRMILPTTSMRSSTTTRTITTTRMKPGTTRMIIGKRIISNEILEDAGLDPDDYEFDF